MTEPIIDQIAKAARISATEICGALIGDGEHVLEAVPLTNQSMRADVSFYIPATAVIRLERAAELDGNVLMGFYHSHPFGDAVPSITDVQNALPGYIYWIASRSGDVRAWQLRDDRTGFDEVGIATRDNR